MQLLENFLPFISRSTQQANESISRSEDKIAQSLLPQDFKEWVPLITTGDGNCLSNSASILIFGNQSLASPPSITNSSGAIRIF